MLCGCYAYVTGYIKYKWSCIVFCGTIVLLLMLQSSKLFPIDLLLSILPPNIDNSIGCFKSFIITEDEATYEFNDHEIKVTIPRNTIPAGTTALMILSASLVAPVKFSKKVIPVSAIVWLHMSVKPSNPIMLQMPHYVSMRKSQLCRLNFALWECSSRDDEEKTMRVIEGGIFKELYGTIEIEPLCYYCIQCEEISKDDVPENEYWLAIMQEIKPDRQGNSWKIHFCIIPKLPTCVKV